MRTPKGGPDDKTPPAVLNSSPENFSTNFISRKIVMEFDEWIQLNDINNQLIVSPPMDPAPTVTLKKRSVIVDLPDNLHENTTYSISFGEGVQDYRASNPASDLRYVFSTGDELDSLKFSGEVVDAFTGAPVKDAKVMLYNELADSIVTQSKPLYFGITDDAGKFKIDYLRSGEFKCFVLVDDNANYTLDEGEKHGWSELVAPSAVDSLAERTIRIHKSEPTTQMLMDYASDSSGFVSLLFSTFSEDIMVEPIDARQGKFMWPDAKDSAYFYLNSGEPGRNIALKITNGEAVIDTIEIDWYQDLPNRILPLNSNLRGSISKDAELRVSSHRVINRLNTDLISCFKDSVELRIDAEIATDRRGVLFSANLQDAGKYRVECLPGAIFSREEWTNDTLEYSFSTHAADHYGNVDFSVSGLPPGDNILQFVNGEDEVIYEFFVAQDTSFSLKRILPETLNLRAIHDLNGNGKWDGGDYWADQQPEPVLHYAGKIQIRSNWDQLLEWRIIGQ